MFHTTNQRNSCVVSFSRVKIAINIYPGIRKLLRGEEDQENEAMRMGREWEPICRRLLQQTCPHWQLFPSCFTYLPEDPSFGGTCDFWMPYHRPEPAVVELKCTYFQTAESVSLWETIPSHYLPQLECEMRAVGYRRAYLVVMARYEPNKNTATEARQLQQRLTETIYPKGVTLLCIWEYFANDRLWTEFIFPRLQLFKHLKETSTQLKREHMSTLQRSQEQFENLRKFAPAPRRILMLDLYDPMDVVEHVEEPIDLVVSGWPRAEDFLGREPALDAPVPMDTSTTHE